MISRRQALQIVGGLVETAYMAYGITNTIKVLMTPNEEHLQV